MTEEAKVTIMFKAEGGAVPLESSSSTKQVKFGPGKPFSAVVDYLKKKVKKQGANDQLFIYIHKFCPSLDESIEVLFNAYKEELQTGVFCLTVSYAPLPIYG